MEFNQTNHNTGNVVNITPKLPKQPPFDLQRYLKPGDTITEETPLATLQTYYEGKAAYARKVKPRAILEIGVCTGYSAAAFLSACPKASYLGIDLDTNTFGGLKGGPVWAEAMLREAFPKASIEVWIADSRACRERLHGRRFDLTHIDGEHTEEACSFDLETASLVTNGVILVDDYDYLPEVRAAVDKFKQGRDWIYFPTYRGEVAIYNSLAN